MSEDLQAKAIADLRRRIATLEGMEQLGASGTANPASFPQNTPFYRRDLGLWVYYDGTRWLTLHEYVSPHVLVSATANGTQVAIRASGTAYAPYISRIVCIVRVNTTNNVSNYWSIAVRGLSDALAAATTMHTFVTSGQAAGVFARGEANPPTTRAPANYSAFDCALTFGAGAPGGIDVTTAIYFRLIIP